MSTRAATLGRRSSARISADPCVAIRHVTGRLQDLSHISWRTSVADLLADHTAAALAAPRALRKTMNQTIFTRLRLDGNVVTTDELAEPFDVIVPAGRTYERRAYQRKDHPHR
jgi:hypothetical protein